MRNEEEGVGKSAVEEGDIGMTLEERIGLLIESLGKVWWSSIDLWQWKGAPLEYMEYVTYKEGTNTKVTNTKVDILHPINQLIYFASVEECLTSPSEYIRECKKYYESGRTDKFSI